MYCRKEKTILSIIFLFIAISLFSEIRAVWVPAWDLADSTTILEVVKTAKEHNINELLAEIRFRGDALYVPHKYFDDYPNPEVTNHIIKDTLFDPFQYLIDEAHKRGIKVQAWVTTFLATPHDVSYIDSNHVYNTHPQWVTYDMYHKMMSPKTLEGAYLDPGLTQVRNYLLDVFSDIIQNYKPDGFHLDYVRYPDYIYGYNPLSWRIFLRKNKTADGEKWIQWKRANITNFVIALRKRIKEISPKTKLTAAVIWKLETAREKYAQDWLNWLKNGYMDRIYMMAYTKSNEDFYTYMDTVSTLEVNKKIVVGLRAWDDRKQYPAKDIIYKINVVRDDRFKGFCLFSSTGLKQNDYWKKLRRILKRK